MPIEPAGGPPVEPVTFETGTTERKKSLGMPIGLIVAGVVIFVLGQAAFILPMVRRGFGGESFQGPGTHTVQIDDPGEWTVWHESGGVVNGAFRTSAGAPPGTTITVTHEGAPVQVRSATGQTMTVGSTERTSLVAFDAPDEGAYEIVVAGDFPPEPFYVGKLDVLGLMKAIFATCFTSVLGAGVGIWGVVLLIIRIARK